MSHPRLLAASLAAVFPVVAFPAGASAGEVIVPAGSGDDAAAITAALRSAAPGDVVLLEAATYELASPIDARDLSGVTLAGPGTLRYVGPAAATGSVVNASGSTGVTLAGLTIDAANLAGNGVDAFASDRLSVRAVTVRDVGVAGSGTFSGFGVAGLRAQGLTVDASTFTNVGTANAFGAAVRVEDAAGALVTGNTITDTGRNGVVLTRVTHARVAGNTIAGTGRFRDFAAANNLDVNTDGLAIEIFGDGAESHSHVVEHNTVDHWISLDRTSRTAVRGNVVDGSSSDYTQLAGLELAGAGRDVTFTDNRVGPGQYVGLSVSNAGLKTNVLAAGNVIDSVAEFGVQLQGNDGGGGAGNELRQIVLAGNTVTNVRRDGVFGVGDAGSDGTGVRLLNNVFDAAFIDNLVTGNDAGVVLGNVPGDVDEVSFVGNTVADNGPGAGLLVDFGVELAGDWSGEAAHFAGNAIDGYAGDPAGKGDAGVLTLSVTGPRNLTPGEIVTLDLGLDPEAYEALWDVGHGTPLTGTSITTSFADDATVHVAVWDRATGNGGYLALAVAVPEPALLAPLGLTGVLLRRRR